MMSKAAVAVCAVLACCASAADAAAGCATCPSCNTTCNTAVNWLQSAGGKKYAEYASFHAGRGLAANSSAYLIQAYYANYSEHSCEAPCAAKPPAAAAPAATPAAGATTRPAAAFIIGDTNADGSISMDEFKHVTSAVFVDGDAKKSSLLSLALPQCATAAAKVVVAACDASKNNYPNVNAKCKGAIEWLSDNYKTYEAMYKTKGVDSETDMVAIQAYQTKHEPMNTCPEPCVAMAAAPTPVPVPASCDVAKTNYPNVNAKCKGAIEWVAENYAQYKTLYSTNGVSSATNYLEIQTYQFVHEPMSTCPKPCAVAAAPPPPASSGCNAATTNYPAVTAKCKGNMEWVRDNYATYAALYKANNISTATDMVAIQAYQNKSSPTSGCMTPCIVAGAKKPTAPAPAPVKEPCATYERSTAKCKSAIDWLFVDANYASFAGLYAGKGLKAKSTKAQIQAYLKVNEPMHGCLAVCPPPAPAPPSNDIERAFVNADQDGDYKLSLGEFVNMTCPPVGASAAPPPSCMPAAASGDDAADITDSFSAHDADKNGILTGKEYQAAWEEGVNCGIVGSLRGNTRYYVLAAIGLAGMCGWLSVKHGTQYVWRTYCCGRPDCCGESSDDYPAPAAANRNPMPEKGRP